MRIVLDVNETMLDLAALDPHFERVFGAVSARMAWFAMTLRATFAATLMDAYRPFAEFADASLDAVAYSREIDLGDADRAAIHEAIATLPAHPDVLPALARLRDAGHELVVLAQSSQTTLERQLAHAGIAPYLARIVSVDDVRRCKPHPAAYDLVRETSDGAKPVLVAAHDWDVAGALHAGFDAAFVRRGRAMPYPSFAPRPLYDVPDFTELAETLGA